MLRVGKGTYASLRIHNIRPVAIEPASIDKAIAAYANHQITDCIEKLY